MPTRATRTSTCPTSSWLRSRSWSPTGWTARRCRRSSATAARKNATGRASCSSGSCSPAPRGPACFMRTRTRATSGCSTTAGWACSTSAPWTGCRAGCRRSSDGCCGSCTTTTRTSQKWSGNCAQTGSCGPGSTWTSTRCTLSWRRSPSRPRWTASSSAANGCARRRPASPTCGPATSRASSTCRRLTCSSTACPRPASGYCASSSAKASSAPRCSVGARLFRSRPGGRVNAWRLSLGAR